MFTPKPAIFFATTYIFTQFRNITYLITFAGFCKNVNNFNINNQ